MLSKRRAVLASFGVFCASVAKAAVIFLSITTPNLVGVEERGFYVKLLQQETVKSVLSSPRKQPSDVAGKESDAFMKDESGVTS